MRRSLFLTLFALAFVPLPRPGGRAVGRPEAARQRRPGTLARRRPTGRARHKAAGRPLAVWLDASGKGRHLRQPTEAARPRLLKHGDARGRPVRRRGRPPAGGQAGRGRLEAFTVVRRRRAADEPRRVPRVPGLQRRRRPRLRDRADHRPGAGRRRPEFTSLNVEGRGFGGWRQPAEAAAAPFGQLYTLEVQRRPSGRPAGRGRQAAGRAAAAAGAAQPGRDHRRGRFYTNGPGPQAGPRLRPVRHRRGAGLRPRR